MERAQRADTGHAARRGRGPTPSTIPTRLATTRFHGMTDLDLVLARWKVLHTLNGPASILLRHLDEECDRRGVSRR